MILRNALFVVVGINLACGTAGCATATVAAAGTVAGIAATAISTGGEIYRLGKLDAADEVRYERWITACREAVRDLHYTPEKDLDKGNGSWICIVRDDRRSRVDITVERRTEMICLTNIDVGFFGSEPTARLILAAARRRAANPATTRPTTLSTERVPPRK